MRPSKKLLDHTSDMINKRQIFNLIDEQIAAYNAIMHKAKQLAKTKQKSAVIVKGGPGTGKSVIALEVMGELLRQGKKVVHATGSSAFTNTLRKIVGVRARSLFKFFNTHFADEFPKPAVSGDKRKWAFQKKVVVVDFLFNICISYRLID